jgi:hypothetical protein
VRGGNFSSQRAYEEHLLISLFQGSFFTEYRVESNNNNQVNVEVSPESLVHALRSASSPGSDTVLKLAKRDNDPVLSLEIHAKVRFTCICL